MAFDILSYTACKEITYAVTCNGCAITAISQKYTCLTPNNAHESWRWNNHNNDIVLNTSISNVLCITPNSTCMCGSTGVCCLWTVPTGATKVKFELWGPGGPGGVSNCCGYAPSGATGAYMSFEIPAVPGCQYTLCAGPSNPHCPYCCGCSNYNTAGCYCTWPGCYTNVTGYGLCNVCAPGGYLDLVQNMCARLCRIGYTSSPTPCRFVNEVFYAAAPNSCGPTICYCVGICNCGSQPTYYMHPVADWGLWPCGCVTIGLCQYTPILRIPVMHSGQCTDTNAYGIWFINPPQMPINTVTAYSACTDGLYGPALVCCTTGASVNACQASWSMYCCCMGQPGMPGHGTGTGAGTTGLYADRGRHGAVKVTWAGTANNTWRCSNV